MISNRVSYRSKRGISLKVPLNCTEGNFGGSKFSRIAKFWYWQFFNLANLWPCTIEHAQMVDFYLANGYQNAKFTKFSPLQIFCCTVVWANLIKGLISARMTAVHYKSIQLKSTNPNLYNSSCPNQQNQLLLN